MNAPTIRKHKQCPYAAAERQVTLRILSRMAADIDTLRDCPSFAGNYEDDMSLMGSDGREKWPPLTWLVDRLRDAFVDLHERVVDGERDSLTV